MKTIQTIGRYRVDALLGSGAMGEVYRAYDPLIDRPVAIKVVRPELLAGSGAEQWLERFRREARAAGRRFHPHIVAILDIGEDNGVPFLAMEYVEGRTLDGILKTEAPLEMARSVAIITQVLSALGFAHQNGIVHRDVKPANIMVLANGDIKVADFGIARIDDSEFTIVGDVLGTPAYMAPEQLAGATADARTDLFAAAVILFEMLSGVKPFRGASVTEIIARMERRPEDIGVVQPDRARGAEAGHHQGADVRPGAALCERRRIFPGACRRAAREGSRDPGGAAGPGTDRPGTARRRTVIRRRRGA